MTSLLLFIIIILILAAAIVLIGVLAYNRRLDRVMKGEARGTHSAIPEPKTTAGVIYRIVLIALVIVTLMSVSVANGTILSLQNAVSTLQSENSGLSERIDELREQLEQEARLTEEENWELSNPDYADLTAEVTYSVRLKSFTENAAVTLLLNGREVSLATDGAGNYSGSFTAPFFEYFGQAAVRVDRDGTSVLEPVDFPEYIFWDLLPMPGFTCDFTSKTVFGKLKYNGSFTVDLDHTEDVASVSLTYLAGGEELKTVDITQQVLQRERITPEKGLPTEKDLTFRVEIATKTGLKIVQQSVMIYDVLIEPDEMEYLKILDGDGNTLWEDGSAY